MAVLDELLNKVITHLGVPSGKLGNVVFLPGILGSDLADGANETLWLLPPMIDQLRLAPSGTAEDSPTRTVHPVRPNLPHAAMLHVLELSWNVLAFAYDWRHDIFAAAHLLEQAVTTRFRGEPFHIVAHSMGGLVARVLRAQAPSIQRGGKLAMLATPNHGSYLAVQLLTLDTAARGFFMMFGANVPPNTAMVAARTWPGAYQLLPCPVQDSSIASFFAHPPSDLSPGHLAAAQQFHTFLHRAPVDRTMFYVGGANVPTLDGAAAFTSRGDGVVSHRLGFLAGIDTFTVTSNHIDLLSNPLVLASITPLLHDGSHGLLHPVG